MQVHYFTIEFLLILCIERQHHAVTMLFGYLKHKM